MLPGRKHVSRVVKSVGNNTNLGLSRLDPYPTPVKLERFSESVNVFLVILIDLFSTSTSRLLAVERKLKFIKCFIEFCIYLR